MDKNKYKKLAKISAIVFAIIAFLHLIRIILRIEATIANRQIPIIISAIAVILASYLAYENWKISK